MAASISALSISSSSSLLSSASSIISVPSLSIVISLGLPVAGFYLIVVVVTTFEDMPPNVFA